MQARSRPERMLGPGATSEFPEVQPDQSWFSKLPGDFQSCSLALRSAHGEEPSLLPPAPQVVHQFCLVTTRGQQDLEEAALLGLHRPAFPACLAPSAAVLEGQAAYWDLC